MDREQAIEYLEKKGKIDGEVKYRKEDEEKIVKVMKEGKIYGDPIADVQF